MRGGYLYILGGVMTDCVRGRGRGNCDGIGHEGSGYGDDMAGSTTNDLFSDVKFSKGSGFNPACHVPCQSAPVLGR